jgi:hypothetical protein
MKADLTLGRTSIQSCSLACAHDFPLNTATEVAVWLAEEDSSDTTSFSGEYADAAKGKLKATPGYDRI